MADSEAQNPQNAQNAQNASSGEFYVKNLTGKAIPVTFDPNMTIGMLKQEITNKEGVPVDQQRLIFHGKQLEDHLTLAAYEIGVGSNVHLVLRLRGGDAN